MCESVCGMRDVLHNTLSHYRPGPVTHIGILVPLGPMESTVHGLGVHLARGTFSGPSRLAVHWDGRM